MKDLLIALAILLILVAVFSHTPQTPPQRDTSGTQTKGESDTVLPGSEDTQYAEPPQSPQTGGWRWFI
ncbi:MAG: hypothetical protein J6V15_00865 [Clostridia bacterium]|jgi:hypothetical protein|nr:hypothetical protein [Clostridia bacterium]